MAAGDTSVGSTPICRRVAFICLLARFLWALYDFGVDPLHGPGDVANITAKIAGAVPV
jgi:hypothetical protein